VQAATGANRALASDVLASDSLTVVFVLSGLAAVKPSRLALLTRVGK